MNSTLVLLIVFITLGVIIAILKRYTGKDAKKRNTHEDAAVAEEPQVSNDGSNVVSECCGAHEICEKTGRYNPQFKPDYYDDEELDAYKGISPDDYTDEQIAEFEEVLMTMKESDVAGWLKSLNLRGIELPYPIRDKALLILG